MMAHAVEMGAIDPHFYWTILVRKDTVIEQSTTPIEQLITLIEQSLVFLIKTVCI